MDGAFAVLPGVDVPAYVLLCDDVFTSGATMDAAARALKEAGAKTVWGFVIARG
jgi:predicted amidophosphoribosyltransferase